MLLLKSKDYIKTVNEPLYISANEKLDLEVTSKYVYSLVNKTLRDISNNKEETVDLMRIELCMG